MKLSLLIYFFFFFFFSVFVSVSARAESYDPTDDLIAAFGGQCSSSGDLTDAALSQSGALKGVISAIKNDTACQSLIPLANNMETDLAATLQNRSEEENLGHNVDDLNAALQVELAKPSRDLTYIGALQAELASERIQLVRAKQDTSRSLKQKPNVAAQNFYAHSTAFLDGLAASSDCVNKHPNILAQAGAQILKSSADFASGMTGSVLLTAGGAIDHFVQFIRNYEISKAQRGLINARMSHALGCTFEGLASTYCRARDLRLVVEANKNAQTQASCGTVAEGTNLLSRDLAAFQAFVDSIYAGSPASGAATATEKTGVITLRSGLENLKVTLDGDTSGGEKNYESSHTPAEKNNATRALLQKLTNDVIQKMNVNLSVNGGNYSQTGPIGDTFSSDPTCGVLTYYYTRGASQACIRDVSDGFDPSTSCMTCINRKFPTAGLPTIAEIKTTSKTILGFGNDYVSRQEGIYKQNNPQLALSTSETYGPNQKSARDFLANATTYLEHLKAEPGGIYSGTGSQMRKTIDNSLDRIKKVQESLDASRSGTGDPADTTKNIVGLVAPGSDTNYIPRELSLIVKQDLDTKLAAGKIDPQLSLILELSTSDSLSEFMDSYKGLESIRTQIRDAKRLTRENLDSVGKIFGENINDILQKMTKDAEGSPDAKDDLALFCVQTLLIPAAPKVEGANVTKYCKNTSYKPLDSKSKSLDFNDLAQKSYDERACSVYDFYRRERLKGLGVQNHSSPAK